MSLVSKKGSANVSVEIPVLCKFWQEQDVWNGVTEDLPIVVYGATFEEARQNMSNAIITHLESLQELKCLEKTIEFLRDRSKQWCLSEDDMPLNQPLIRMSATLQNRQILALV